MTEHPDATILRLKSIAPQFVVPDVVKAAEYYRDALGFEILGYFLDPPVFAMVIRDGVEIHFGKQDSNDVVTNETKRRDGLDAYIWVTDVHAMDKDLKARGANILEGPVKRSYGSTEIIVRDCYGYKLAFAE